MFEVEKRGPAIIVFVTGDIDVLTSETFRETVVARENDAERVVISLLDCTYLDSTGLTVLIAAQRRLRERLTIVVGPDGNVRKIIEIASLAQFLNIYTSVDEALAATAG